VEQNCSTVLNRRKECLYDIKVHSLRYEILYGARSCAALNGIASHSGRFISGEIASGTFVICTIVCIVCQSMLVIWYSIVLVKVPVSINRNLSASQRQAETQSKIRKLIEK
jgi:hypothetical protein